MANQVLFSAITLSASASSKTGAVLICKNHFKSFLNSSPVPQPGPMPAASNLPNHSGLGKSVVEVHISPITSGVCCMAWDITFSEDSKVQSPAPDERQARLDNMAAPGFVGLPTINKA